MRGERREILWHNAVLTDEAGRIVEILASGEDITQRKRIELELRQSHAKSRAILEALPDLMFRLSRSGEHLEFYSPTPDQLFVQPEQFLGKTVAEVLPEGVASAYETNIDKVLHDRLPREFEYSLEFSERGLRAYEARMVASGSDEVLVIVRDMSERKQLEGQLRQTHKMEALGQLAAGVAHDFNNILTAILGNADVGLELVKGEKSPEQPLRQIRQSANTAAALTKTLLVFTRRQVTQLADLDLARILDGMQGMLQSMLGERIALSVRVPTDLQRVRVDPGQLEQIIINLVVNGRDAIEGEGEVSIEASNQTLDEREPAKHPSVPAGAYVVLAVRDTGSGMDEATARRAFEPFFTTKPGTGTGLGLATVSSIVKQSDGHIEMSSSSGEGTTFRIYLPGIAIAAEAPKAQPPPGSGQGTETLLVCEDDSAVRRLMVEPLEGSGYQVLAADRGETALRIARGHDGRIDLLITDVILPGMSGSELSDTLAGSGREIQTLFVSGYAGGMLEKGAFLPKPFSRGELLQRVREILDTGPASV